MDASAIRITAGAQQTFLTVEMAREHLVVDTGSDDNAYISTIVAAAIAHVENFTGLYLAPRVVTERVDAGRVSFPYELNAAPVRSLSSVVLQAEADAAGIFPPDGLFAPGKLRLADGVNEDISGYLSFASVKPFDRADLYALDAFAGLEFGSMYIRYDVGCAQPLAIDAPLLQAILLLVGDLYEHRVTEVPYRLNKSQAQMNLLANYRLWS